MKPIIGIVMRPELSSGKKPIMYTYKVISTAIIKCGGIPLGIEPTETQKYFGKNLFDTFKMSTENFLDTKQIIDLCDGIICQGGDDFYDYDLKIIKYCYDNDIPLLGCQAMGYLFKGEVKRLDHLEHDCPGHKYSHRVVLNKDSKLYDILKVSSFMVNSRHRDYIVKTDLDVSCFSDDFLIEAVEDKHKKFFIGVQWHPEVMIEYDMLMKSLLIYFINICLKDDFYDGAGTDQNC
ncbi:MAG: gamma-glutamyl-gamma-aminobutyrate hydrolase family protein [Bacilli bacterium]